MLTEIRFRHNHLAWRFSREGNGMQWRSTVVSRVLFCLMVFGVLMGKSEIVLGQERLPIKIALDLDDVAIHKVPLIIA